MIVTIHQPEHLPWIGYFNKIDKADLLVHLDNVQFEKNNFQNRNRIYLNNQVAWLTVPVILKNHIKGDISQVLIDNNRDWRKKYLNSIYHAYCRYPYFSKYYGDIVKIIEKKEDYIMNLNIQLLEYFFQILGIQTRTVRASNVIEHYGGKENLLNLCTKLKADCYLSGSFGRNYLETEKFERNGIEVLFNDYTHPTYKQYKTTEFKSHLSILDLLFNYGADEAIAIIRNN